MPPKVFEYLGQDLNDDHFLSLCRLQYEEVADKDDLMGVEDTAKKDIL